MIMQPIRKPRVFLSHSKKDVEFVRRLDADLRACQCETWIDEIEIRHGRPWLDEIFSAGIPSCEVLLCYITENAIDSEMVQQEIDARLLERLQKGRVGMLLYLAADHLRPKLRLDLQRLQSPVLNDATYNEVLPRMVAEIWRSYAELLSTAAAQSERVKRLEAELRVKELESNAAASVFSPREMAEFAAIWSRLDREIEISVDVVKRMGREIGDLQELDESLRPEEQSTKRAGFCLLVGKLFRSAVATQKFQPSERAVHAAIDRDVLFHMQLPRDEYEVRVVVPVDIETELLRYGLVERQAVLPQPTENRVLARMRPGFRVVFTTKFDRFLFWLEHSFGQWQPLDTVVRPRS